MKSLNYKLGNQKVRPVIIRSDVLYVFKLFANAWDDDFLYFMPLSLIKSLTITISAQRECHIRIVRLENEFYLLCSV